MSLTPSINNTRTIAACIILFTAFLFLFNTGKRDLWAPDEPRYAQVSKEMRDSGNFIVPHLNSEPYPDKPPLLFWLINLFSIPFGKITALSSRLPSAFAGIGCCLAIFYLGKSLYHNTRIALLAALFLATSSKFLWMAHRVAFDVPLTFFVTMAILCFYKGYAARHGRSLTTPPCEEWDKGGVKKQERRYYTLFYIFMALGVLTKGPIGFILPFCIVLTYIILKKDIYVLSLYPAAALITAWFLNEFVEQFREKHFKKIGYYPCYILCGVSLVLSILLPIVVYKLYPQYTSSTIPFVAILLIGGLVMLRFVRYARIIPFLFTIIFVIFFAFTIGTLKAIPILNQYKSAKEICDNANSVMKPGEKLAMYNFFRDPYLFYTNRNHIEVLRGTEELRRFLNSNERVFLFIQEKDFNKVSKLLEIPMFVLEKDFVGHRDMLFISNKDI